MAKRSKRPSEFRCLVGVVYGVYAFLMVRVLTGLNEALCIFLNAQAALPECAPVPAAFIHLIYWAGVGACALTCYRAYRDFCVGDYYRDLMDHNHRW